MERCYSELIQLDSWEERLAYLQLLDGNVTSPRHMSQSFYKSRTWKLVMEEIRYRDLGYDLGVVGVEIISKPIIHHINPITEDDIIFRTKKLLDPENLILTQVTTHGLIHYAKEIQLYVERKPGDTDLW